MRRRTVIAGIGGVGAAGIAGFAALGQPSGPKAVAKQFIRAMHDGNHQRVEELTKPDATIAAFNDRGEWDGPTGSVSFDSVEWDGINTEAVKRGTAIYTLSTGSETIEYANLIGVEVYEGDWRVYEMVVVSGEPGNGGLTDG